MIYLTGDIESLSDSNRWGMSSTDCMADWDVFYSLMDGRGFWGWSCYYPGYVWSDEADEEMAPF